ncbi:MAG: hypothetical protein PHT40_03435 [Patescibacteria group bacterium]|nr:hypothetical protein [Patescibacteria group bacterium]
MKKYKPVLANPNISQVNKLIPSTSLALTIFISCAKVAIGRTTAGIQSAKLIKN